MKRTLAVLLALGLVGGALAAGPAEAKKKKKKKPKRVERVVEHSYAAPSPGVPGVAGACLAAFTPDSGCIDIPVTLDDKYVMVDITDASGQTPAAILAQDTDSNRPGTEIFHNFCGKTEDHARTDVASLGLCRTVQLVRRHRHAGRHEDHSLEPSVRGARKEEAGVVSPGLFWSCLRACVSVCRRSVSPPRPSSRCSTMPGCSRAACSDTSGSTRAPTRRPRGSASCPPSGGCPGWPWT